MGFQVEWTDRLVVYMAPMQARLVVKAIREACPDVLVSNAVLHALANELERRL